MKVLLSIKPEFVQEIFTGKKKYEYRKAIFTRSVDKVVVMTGHHNWQTHLPPVSFIRQWDFRRSSPKW